MHAGKPGARRRCRRYRLHSLEKTAGGEPSVDGAEPIGALGVGRHVVFQEHVISGVAHYRMLGG